MNENDTAAHHLRQAIAATGEADQWRSTAPSEWPIDEPDAEARLAFHDACIKSARLHLDIAKLIARQPKPPSERIRTEAEHADEDYPRAGQRWEPTEQARLEELWDGGASAEVIGAELERRPSAIESRLRKTCPHHPRTIAELTGEPIETP